MTLPYAPGHRVTCAIARFTLRVVVGVLCMTPSGCSKDDPSVPPPASVADFQREVARARDALGANSAADPETRFKSYVALRASIARADDHSVTVNIANVSERVATIDAVVSELKDIDARLAALVTPAEPEKPEWEKPSYEGVFYINGSYRGPYDKGGVVVQKGSTYYLIRDALEPDTYIQYLNGYVEDTGETISLNIGRDGREAKVVTLADKETFRDDQAAYKEEVRNAKADYDAAKKSYPSDVANYNRAKKERDESLAVLTRRRADAEDKRDRLVAEFARSISASDASATALPTTTVVPLTE